MGWRVGVDIGGTFTDVALIEEETGRIAIAKVPTTPQDFAEGVTAGLRQGLARYGVEPTAVSLLSHATTVVTNALLEKKGARAGFVTTRGFRDVLELRRSSRADLYDLFQDAPAVLVQRRWRYEITAHRCAGKRGHPTRRSRHRCGDRRNPGCQARHGRGVV